MGAPINSFEIIESIRFFAQLAGTEGVCHSVKDMANDYMTRLMKTLEKVVDETTAKASGLTLIK